MPEQAGVLDGIREIVHPLMPVITDWSIWLFWGAVIIVPVVFFLLLMVYYQQPKMRARKQYRRLKRNWSTCPDQVCGVKAMSIIRLLQGRHNLTAIDYSDLNISLTLEQWQKLIAQCDELRFSKPGNNNRNDTQVLLLLRFMLWPGQQS